MFVFMSATAFAACSNQCDPSTQYSCSLSTASMTKNTKATLTVSVTNQQSQSQSVTATLQGGWFIGDVTSIAGNTYQSGQATSLDFSVTPTTDGAQSVCVAMGSTCTAECGSVSVASSAELSIPTFTAPSSVSASATFTPSATIQNLGTESATGVTATLSASGPCSVSSASKNIGTMSGKSTSSQSWTVTASSSSGTCSLTLTVTGTTGGTAVSTASTTVSGSSSSSSSSSGGGSGGGGGGGASRNKTSNATQPSEPAENQAVSGSLALCGNGVLNEGEECDGALLAGQTCESKGFASGTLGCNNCRFDTGLCNVEIISGVEIPKVVADYGWLIVSAVFIFVLFLGWIYYHGHHHIKKKLGY